MSDVRVQLSPSDGSSTNTTPDNSGEARPKSRPPGYVVHVPKEQIYRVPPPENAHQYKLYTRRGLRKRRSRSCCCCCLWWMFNVFVVLALAVGVLAVFLYFAYNPKMPRYSVPELTVEGFNLSSTAVKSKSFTPEFDVTVRVENPNKKIGIHYTSGSSLKIRYWDVVLGEGGWPAFDQKRNVTWVWAVLRGPEIRLSDNVRRQLVAEEKHGEVPLVIDIVAPGKLKVGTMKSWTVFFKAHCAVKVDRLAPDSEVVSQDCDLNIRLF